LGRAAAIHAPLLRPRISSTGKGHSVGTDVKVASIRKSPLVETNGIDLLWVAVGRVLDEGRHQLANQCREDAQRQALSDQIPAADHQPAAADADAAVVMDDARQFVDLPGIS
jgi:hypothetical protein